MNRPQWYIPAKTLPHRNWLQQPPVVQAMLKPCSLWVKVCNLQLISSVIYTYVRPEHYFSAKHYILSPFLQHWYIGPSSLLLHQHSSTSRYGSLVLLVMN